jgi:TRAP-type C4-dicarboxylate transport system permease small subunit
MRTNKFLNDFVCSRSLSRFRMARNWRHDLSCCMSIFLSVVNLIGVILAAHYHMERYPAIVWPLVVLLLGLQIGFCFFFIKYNIETAKIAQQQQSRREVEMALQIGITEFRENPIAPQEVSTVAASSRSI